MGRRVIYTEALRIELSKPASYRNREYFVPYGKSLRTDNVPNELDINLEYQLHLISEFIRMLRASGFRAIEKETSVVKGQGADRIPSRICSGESPSFTFRTSPFERREFGYNLFSVCEPGEIGRTKSNKYLRTRGEIYFTQVVGMMMALGEATK